MTLEEYCDRLVEYGDPRLPERFWEKVYPCPITGCWLWGASIDRRGYGTFRYDGDRRFAHRVSLTVLVPLLPRDQDIDHLCRVRCCVNPAHLEFVSHVENMRRARKPYCRRGHLLNEASTNLSSRGTRYCRICNKAKSRAFRERRKCA